MVLANEKPQKVFVKFLRQKSKRMLMYKASVLYENQQDLCWAVNQKNGTKFLLHRFFKYSVIFLFPLNNTPYLIFSELAIIGDIYRGL